MASPLSRRQGSENMPTGKDPRTMNNVSPHRKPLGELATNPRMGPPTTSGVVKKLFPQTTSLKRSNIEILEGDRGFQYLKRRKVGEIRSVEQVRPRGDGVPTEAPRDGHVRSETARFRPAPDLASRDNLIHEQERHGSTTEPNTPDEEDDSGRESQHSFGSLINYEPSSQQAAQGPFAAPGTYSAPRMRAHQRDYRASVRLSQVELLRLRLRIAMYKVRTNQIYTPFARLRVYGAAKPTTASTRRHTPPPSRDSSEEPELPTRARSPVPTGRHGAMEAPRLLSGPVLRPTPYSSKMVFGPPLSSIRADEVQKDTISPERTYYRDERRGSTVELPRVRHSSETTIVYADQSSGDSDGLASVTPRGATVVM